MARSRPLPAHEQLVADLKAARAAWLAADAPFPALTGPDAAAAVSAWLSAGEKAYRKLALATVDALARYETAMLTPDELEARLAEMRAENRS